MIEVLYNIIIIVINLLTKYAKFVLYKSTITSKQLRYLLIKKIFTNHEISEKIISDRDKLFTSTFFDKIRNALEIKEEISTIFHSQIDEQTKRINQTLETYLRIYASNNKHQWMALLSTTQIAINSAYNKDLRQTLQKALYGIQARIPKILETTNPTAKGLAEKMKENWMAIKHRIDASRAKAINWTRHMLKHSESEKSKESLSYSSYRTPRYTRDFISLCWRRRRPIP